MYVEVVLLYKIIWKLLSMKMCIYHHQTVLSAEIVREQRDAEAENLLK